MSLTGAHAVAKDDLGRSQSSRCRDARSPAGATLPSSLIGRARAQPLPRHAGRSADTELASAKDDGCRSYVKRLSLFAVIWARVPGSVGGGHGRFGGAA